MIQNSHYSVKEIIFTIKLSSNFQADALYGTLADIRNPFEISMWGKEGLQSSFNPM